MGLLNLLQTGVSNYGYSGGPVPSTVVNNQPGFTRHNLFSTNGQPNVSSNIIVGGVQGLQAPTVTFVPSQLEETDPLNTAQYRSLPGQGYIDNLPV
jgi:hypothetical protein